MNEEFRTSDFGIEKPTPKLKSRVVRVQARFKLQMPLKL